MAKDLETRLIEHLAAASLLGSGSAITVALSGGHDSVALLHLMHALSDQPGWTISAAHFDHRMRAGSEADADWVKALCERLGIAFRAGRASVKPTSEAEARELRYSFLFRARADLGGEWLATAHHADDQAETVLFRLLRGTGLSGAAGIPTLRHPNVVRPLLPFWRAELEAYSRTRRLQYRSDPTNADLSISRNRLRHWLIPSLEAGEAPTLRHQLLRLSGLAVRASEQLESRLARGLICEEVEGRIVVARSDLLAYDTNACAYVLRHLVGRVGTRPGRVGTRTALEFINTGASGRRIVLKGGTVIRREFDRVIFERAEVPPAAPDGELSLAQVGAGKTVMVIGGVRWLVSWSTGSAPAGDESEVACFATSELLWPLRVRGWRPGDRIEGPAGTRKLKKVFVDRRVGLSERSRLPVVADSSGVLWVVGLTRSSRAVPRDDGEVLTLRFRRETWTR